MTLLELINDLNDLRTCGLQHVRRAWLAKYALTLASVTPRQSLIVRQRCFIADYLSIPEWLLGQRSPAEPLEAPWEVEAGQPLTRKV